MSEQEKKSPPKFAGGDKAWFWSKYFLMMLLDVAMLLGAVATTVLVAGVMFGMGLKFFAPLAAMAVYFGLSPGRKLVMMRVFDRILASDVVKFQIPGLIDAVDQEKLEKK